MTAKENQEIQKFLTGDKAKFRGIVIAILNQLEKEIEFKLKIQKASIQLCCLVPFAVIGFRRSKSFIFVEFYNSNKIDDQRIVKSITKLEKLIINRVNIFSPNEIDKQLLNWIKKSESVVR